MRKNLAVLLLTGIIFSCNQPATKTVIAKAPVDSLISNWNKSWNNHDSAGVRNLFTADALLIDDNLIALNADEFSNKWIQPNINLINNLKTTKLQHWSSGDRAGYTGKYELDIILKDSLLARGKGVFTVNWEKTEKGEWKITTANIHSLTENK